MTIKSVKKKITLLCVAAITFWLVMVAMLVNRLYFPDVYDITVSAEAESVLGAADTK